MILGDSMATLTINLPDDKLRQLHDQMASRGFADAGAYVSNLISKDAATSAADGGAAVTPPASVTFRNREELDRLLRDGIESGPPVVVGPGFADDVMRRVRERVAGREP